MSDKSSIEVDQPPPRNVDNQQGAAQDIHIIPLAHLRFFSPTTARRTITLPNNVDIVKELSAISWTYRQAIYIVSGTGYISEANLSLIPSLEQRICFGRGKILYLNGSFQPMNQNGHNANGVLHVCLSGVQEGVAIAFSLVASGSVQIEVVFICAPWSLLQPDAAR